MRTKGFLTQTCFLIALSINYFLIVGPNYRYYSYYDMSFSLSRLSAVVGLHLLCYALFLCVRGEFYRTTLQALFFFAFLPSLSYYMFNEVSIAIIVIQLIPLVVLTLCSAIRTRPLRRRPVVIGNRTTVPLIVFLLMLTVPYYLRLRTVNWSNLLFSEIYTSRDAYRLNEDFYMGYTSALLAKVVYPLMALYMLHRKRRLTAILFILNVVVIFLTTGAQKDIVVGMLLVLGFFFVAQTKGVLSTMNKIVVWVTTATFIESAVYALSGTQIITTYIRRVFFTIPGLLSKYYEYFSIYGFTHYSHTRLGSLGVDRLNLTRWAGENLFAGSVVNANIGIFAEGYVSWGFVGVLFTSLVFAAICVYLNRLNLDSRYMGLWIAMLYLVNYSLIETLMITHAMLAFLILAYFVIPTQTCQKHVALQGLPPSCTGQSVGFGVRRIAHR